MSIFDSIKYIFQIPIDWFKRVDTRVFGDHPGDGIRFDDASDGSKTVCVDYDQLDQRYGIGEDTGTPVDKRDTSDGDDENGSAFNWSSGGDNGLIISCYCKCTYSSSAGTHMLERVVLTFSADGLLVSAVKTGERIEIGA